MCLRKYDRLTFIVAIPYMERCFYIQSGSWVKLVNAIAADALADHASPATDKECRI